jgi:hypothetical protein
MHNSTYNKEKKKCPANNGNCSNYGFQEVGSVYKTWNRRKITNVMK